MLILWVVFSLILSSGDCDITGTNPPPGSILCKDLQYSVIMYFSSDCNYVTTINHGSCHVYTGKKQMCYVLVARIELFQIAEENYKVWVSGINLILSNQSSTVSENGDSELQAWTDEPTPQQQPISTAALDELGSQEPYSNFESHVTVKDDQGISFLFDEIIVREKAVPDREICDLLPATWSRSRSAKIDTIVVTQTETKSCLDDETCLKIIAELRADTRDEEFDLLVGSSGKLYDGIYAEEDLNVTMVTGTSVKTDGATISATVDFDEDGKDKEGGVIYNVTITSEDEQKTSLTLGLIGNFTNEPPSDEALISLRQFVDCAKSEDRLSSNFTITGACRESCAGPCLQWLLYQPMFQWTEFKFYNYSDCDF